MFAREFRNCLKDPRRFIFIFGASIVYLFLFGMLYQPNIVQKIPTVIFDEDQSKLSREIVQNFSDSDTFEIVDYARDESEMLESIQMKRSLAAIHIPKYFARDRSSILYMVNGSNIIVTNVTSSATLEIVESFEEESFSKLKSISSARQFCIQCLHSFYRDIHFQSNRCRAQCRFSQNFFH